MKSSIWVIILITIIVLALQPYGVCQAAETITGALGASSLIWNRIKDSGSTVDPNCGAAAYDSYNNAMPYAVFEIRTPMVETLSASVNASGTAFDSFLALYCTFDPNNPQASLVAADDDGAGYPHAELTSKGISLLANTSYFLVITSYSHYNPYGNFQIDLGGSAYVVVVVVPQYTLTVSVDPAGGGSVTRNPDQATYDNGAQVQITANAAAGYRFDHWSGALSGSTNPTTITMNANKTVTAHFVKIWTLSANVDPAGGGTVGKNPDQATYDNGAEVLLSAYAAAGYRFDHWSGNLSGSTNPSTITMNANKTVTAHFVKIWTLSANVDPAAGGTVGKNPDQATYDNGAQVQLTANPAVGYRFDHWSGDLSGSTNPASITMNANKTVTAHFVKIWTLSASVDPAGGGTVTNNPDQATYDNGAEVQLTANAAAGYRFDHWSGDLSGNTNPSTITMNANRTIKATFIRQYTLTVNQAGSGSGTVSSTPGGINCGTDCGEAYDMGTLVGLMARPDAGCAFTGWSGDSDCLDGQVTMDAAKSCTATFSLLHALNVSVEPYGGGVVEGRIIHCPPICEESYIEGARVTLAAAPAQGYVFDRWSGCSSSNSQCEITVNSPATVTAYFRRSMALDVNVLPPMGGRVIGEGIDCPQDCRADYDAPTQVFLTASPGEGFVFTGWNRCDSAMGNQCNVLVDREMDIRALFAPETGHSMLYSERRDLFSRVWMLYIPAVHVMSKAVLRLSGCCWSMT